MWPASSASAVTQHCHSHVAHVTVDRRDMGTIPHRKFTPPHPAPPSPAPPRRGSTTNRTRATRTRRASRAHPSYVVRTRRIRPEEGQRWGGPRCGRGRAEVVRTRCIRPGVGGGTGVRRGQGAPVQGRLDRSVGERKRPTSVGVSHTCVYDLRNARDSPGTSIKD